MEEDVTTEAAAVLDGAPGLAQRFRIIHFHLVLKLGDGMGATASS